MSHGGKAMRNHAYCPKNSPKFSENLREMLQVELQPKWNNKDEAPIANSIKCCTPPSGNPVKYNPGLWKSIW